MKLSEQGFTDDEVKLIRNACDYFKAKKVVVYDLLDSKDKNPTDSMASKVLPTK